MSAIALFLLTIRIYLKKKPLADPLVKAPIILHWFFLIFDYGSTRRVIPMYWAYHTLGCAPGASETQVKKNYRRLIMMYHPDRLLHTTLPDDQKRRDLQKFFEVQKAWEALEGYFEESARKVA